MSKLSNTIVATLTSIALCASAVAVASSGKITRTEMKLSPNVGVTCVTVDRIITGTPSVDDHIVNTGSTSSMSFVNGDKTYFCNAVIG